MRRFELLLPEDVENCVRMLGERGAEAKVVAGGTDLVPQMKVGVTRPAYVLDLSGLAELKVLEGTPDGWLHLGSAVTARDLEVAPQVRQDFAALADGAGLVGSLQVRNLATVGGNICNAAPSADMVPPLLVLEAEAVVVGPGGRRRVPLEQFFLGPRRTVLQPGELLVELLIPRPVGATGSAYLRHTPRRELDIAVVGAAALVSVEDGRCVKARIALASVAPTPLRVPTAEALLEGERLTPELLDQAGQAAAAAARPISDQRGSAEYRRHLTRVLTRRALSAALERATARGNGA